MNVNNSSWTNLIILLSKEPKFKSRTCCIFNDQSKSLDQPDKLCPCGRMIRRHSFTGDCVESKEAKNATSGSTRWQHPAEFMDKPHSTTVPINVFGTLTRTDCKFLRIDARLPLEDLFQLILEDCERQKPALILSVYGGAKYFTMTERLEKEFIRGIIDAATMASKL